jgi:hypothetical protein
MQMAPAPYPIPGGRAGSQMAPSPLQGVGPGMLPPGAMMQPGVPNSGYAMPQPKSYTALAAGALVVMALLGLMGVVLFTKAFWPAVKLECEPRGATVVVDGKTLSVKAPLEVKLKPYTPHKVEFRYAGYASKVLEPPIELGYLGSADRVIALERLRRRIHVSPVPGQLFINDKLIGAGADIELPTAELTGKVAIRIEAPGHKPFHMAFEGVDQMPESLDVPLAKE